MQLGVRFGSSCSSIGLRSVVEGLTDVIVSLSTVTEFPRAGDLASGAWMPTRATDQLNAACGLALVTCLP
jgi:hypothetical protein